jgi:hypothetical protein
MNIGEITVKIGADNVELVNTVNSSKTALGSLDNSVKAGAATFGKYTGAALAAAAALGTALVVKSLDAVAAQDDLAKTLRTTNEAMATLKRGGDLAGVSMEQISAGARALNINLGRAATEGAGPAHEALKRLGMSAAELSAIPLDQRIATINQALRDNVPAAQQAAVAADLFGARAAQAIMKLDSGSLQQAAREIEILGLRLSEVDATAVNNATDDMGVFAMAVDGAGQQLAVRFAPILSAISKDFLNATENAGGMGSAMETAFNSGIEAAAFLANAADGVGRVFELTAKGIVIAFQGVVTTVGGAITTLVTTADDALQAIGIETLGEKAQAVRDKFDQHMAVMNEAAKDFNETLERPLAGDRFEKYVADAQAAATEAASAMVAAGVPGSDPSGTPTEADTKAADAEQKAFESRLAALQGQHITVQELDRQHQQAMEDVRRGFEEGRILTVEENNELMAQLAEQHAARVGEIEHRAAMEQEQQQAASLAKRRAAQQQFFSNMSTLMNSGSRKAFEIGKAAATAGAVVDGIRSAVSAFAAGMSVGGPAAPAVAAAYMAASLAATGAQISAIQSQQFGGGGAKGGAGGAASATQAVNAASTPVGQAGGGGGGSQYTIAGLNQDELFSGKQVRALITRMNEERRDGSRLEFQ